MTEAALEINFKRNGILPPIGKQTVIRPRRPCAPIVARDTFAVSFQFRLPGL